MPRSHKKSSNNGKKGKKSKRQCKIITDYLAFLDTNQNVKPFFKKLFRLIFVNAESSKYNYENLLRHILSGGYCVIANDNGYVFDELVKMFKSSKRLKKGIHYGKGGFDGFSTHFSEGDQYRLGSGALFDTSKEINTDFDLVIGKRPVIESWQYKNDRKKRYFKKYQGDTWFQFEGFRTETRLQKIKHGISTIDYGLNMLASKIIPGTELRNIGPYGKSIYTEFNPLVLSFTGKNSNNLSVCRKL